MNLCMGTSVERKATMLFPRSEQALLTSRNISAAIVIISVTKYTNHVAEDNFFFKKQHCHPCVANWVWALQDTRWQGMFVYGVHEKDCEAKAILWFRSGSVAPADLFSSSTQEMPCLTSMITLFNKDQSMHHPLTFEKGWEGTLFMKVFVESSVYPSHFGR